MHYNTLQNPISSVNFTNARINLRKCNIKIQYRLSSYLFCFFVYLELPPAKRSKVITITTIHPIATHIYQGIVSLLIKIRWPDTFVYCIAFWQRMLGTAFSPDKPITSSINLQSPGFILFKAVKGCTNQRTCFILIKHSLK